MSHFPQSQRHLDPVVKSVLSLVNIHPVFLHGSLAAGTRTGVERYSQHLTGGRSFDGKISVNRLLTGASLRSQIFFFSSLGGG